MLYRKLNGRSAQKIGPVLLGEDGAEETQVLEDWGMSARVSHRFGQL